jgi:hypothetical protein
MRGGSLYGMLFTIYVKQGSFYFVKEQFASLARRETKPGIKEQHSLRVFFGFSVEVTRRYGID